MSNVLWSSPSSMFLFLVFDHHAIQGKIKRKKWVVKCITGMEDDGEQKNTQKLLTC